MTKAENYMPEKVAVEKVSVRMLINTLKQIDVRGFDSMDRLVGAVMVLEDILSRPSIAYEEEKQLESEVNIDG